MIDLESVVPEVKRLKMAPSHFTRIFLLVRTNATEANIEIWQWLSMSATGRYSFQPLNSVIFFEEDMDATMFKLSFSNIIQDSDARTSWDLADLQASVF